MDLIDIYRKQCTPSRRILFSSVPEIFIKIGHILGHKTTKKKCKVIEIIPTMFFDHKGNKLEISNRSYPNT